ncbi:TPA: type VI secretion system-associated protein TagO [Pasteurella multocida]
MRKMILIMLLPLSVFANQDPKKCADIESVSHRLDCYDSIFGKKEVRKESAKEDNKETKWVYSESKSEMSNTEYVQVSIDSENSVNFSFPYQGEQKARLRLWRSKKGNTDYLTFSIKKGQIVCRTGSGCSLSIKIDDDDEFYIKGDEPSDSDSTYTTVKLTGDEAFRISRASKILIQPTIYKQGYPIFKFDVKNNPYPCCAKYPFFKVLLPNIENGATPNLELVKEEISQKTFKQCMIFLPYRLEDKNLAWDESGVYTKKEHKDSVEWVKYQDDYVEKFICNKKSKQQKNIMCRRSNLI